MGTRPIWCWPRSRSVTACSRPNGRPISRKRCKHRPSCCPINSWDSHVPPSNVPPTWRLSVYGRSPAVYRVPTSATPLRPTVFRRWRFRERPAVNTLPMGSPIPKPASRPAEPPITGHSSTSGATNSTTSTSATTGRASKAPETSPSSPGVRSRGPPAKRPDAQPPMGSMSA